jgi:hypothetical protein
MARKSGIRSRDGVWRKPFRSHLTALRCIFLGMAPDAGGKLCSCSFVRVPTRISTIKQEGVVLSRRDRLDPGDAARGARIIFFA